MYEKKSINFENKKWACVQEIQILHVTLHCTYTCFVSLLI